MKVSCPNCPVEVEITRLERLRSRLYVAPESMALCQELGKPRADGRAVRTPLDCPVLLAAIKEAQTR